MDNLQSEEQKIIREGEEAIRLLESGLWHIIKNAFSEEIMDLQSILNLESSEAKAMALEVKARTMAIDKLRTILMKIEGKAEVIRKVDKPVEDGVINTIDSGSDNKVVNNKDERSSDVN